MWNNKQSKEIMINDITSDLLGSCAVPRVMLNILRVLSYLFFTAILEVLVLSSFYMWNRKAQ